MKKKTRNMILILSIVLVLVLLPLSIFLLSKYVFQQTGNKANVEWYDENGTEFVITTADELYGMIALSDFYDFKGQTIKLGADIVVNEGDAADWAVKAPSRKWYPISGFAGTFDGQGHTISGIYGKSVDMAMGLFSDTQRDCVIKNFKLVNSYFSGASEGVGSISAYGGGLFDTIYSNAIIETKNPYAGGFVGQMNIAGEHKLSNCWYDGNIKMTTEEAIYGGCFVGAIAGDGSIVTMEHSLNTGVISAEGTSRGVDVGGYSGLVTTGSVVHVTDCLNSGLVETKYTTRVGSLFGNIQSGARTFTSHVYATTECFGATMGYLGGNVQGAPVVYPTALMEGYGAYQWTTLDFDNYWAVVMEDTPMLRAFTDNVPSLAGIEKCYDDTWYDEFSTDFTISTLEEFYGFYILSANDNFEGKTIYLGDDLVVNEGKASEWGEKAPENIWYPINSFAGTFDGQGHTISGVYVKGQNQKQGLFAETTTAAMITNLRITNSYFESTSTGMAIIGSAVGRGNGIIDTVYSDAIIVCSGTGCGGIVGQVYTGMTNLISNCWFDGTIRMTTTMGKQCGGILGITRSDVEIEHCLNTGTITAEDTRALRIGGILGIAAGADFTATIRDCLSAGNITVANSRVGAALAEVGANTSVVMRDVYATTESLSDGKNYINKAISVINKGGKADGSAVLLPEKELKGIGAYQWTTLNFEKFWAAKSGKTPELLSFTSGNNMSVAGVKKKMDTSWYDAKATSYTIDSVEDLYGLFITSALTDFKGKTVKLGANLTVNTGNASDWGTKAPANIWYPINVFAGTFDGQGNTISGIYLKDVNQKLGLFGETTVDATIKNLRLTNSYFESTSTGMAILGSVVGRGNGTIDSIYSDAILVSCGTGNGGIVGQVYTEGKNKITNCWFDGSITMNDKGGRQAGGILGITRTGVTIEHCLNTGTITTKETSALRIGGILGVVVGGTFTANVTDCLNAGTIVSTNSRVGSIVAEVSANTTLAMKDVYATTESFSNGSSYINKTIGHTDKEGKVDGAAIVLSEAALKGAGGYRWTTLNFAKYWATKSDTTPELLSFTSGESLNTSAIVQANTSWYKAGQKNFTITTKEQLYGLAKLSLSNNFSGVTINLGANITVNGGSASDWGTTAPSDQWVPIGTADVPFAGTFNGNGNTISGIYLKSSSQYSGLFGKTTSSASVKNLKLINSYFEFDGSKNAFMGSIAGGGGGTFDTVYSEAIMVSSGLYNGGIIGSMTSDNAKVVNSWFAGSIALGTNKGQYAGGITGHVSDDANVYVSNCLNTGTLTGTFKTGDTIGLIGIGGICGYVYAGKINIMDTLNVGEINAVGNWQGSMIGRIGHGDEDETHAVAEFSNTYYSTDNRTTSRDITIHGGSTVGKAEGMTLAGLSNDGGWLNTELDFVNYWSAMSGETPELKSFASGTVLAIWTGEGTEESPWTLSTADEFKRFAAASENHDYKNEYIELGGNITIDDGTKNWTTIGTSSKAFAGHFNGNKNTISGLYYKGADDYIGLFGNTAAGSTVKNLKLADSSFESTYTGNVFIGSIVGCARGTFENIKVESDVTVKSQGFLNGGIAGAIFSGADTLISNCWFAGTLEATSNTGRQTGGIVGRVYAPGREVVIEHCLNAGTVSATRNGMAQIGGIVGFVQAFGTFEIRDCLNATSIVNPGTGHKGAIIGHMGYAEEYKLTDVYATKASASDTITLVGEDAGTMQDLRSKLLTTAEFTGDAAWILTTLDFAGNWDAIDGSTPVLEYFTEGTVLTPWTGEGTEGAPWILSNVEEFNRFVKVSQIYDFATKHISLGTAQQAGTLTYAINTGTVDEINATNPANWIPIGNSSKLFAGHFNGNKNTISGLYYDGAGTYIGLFAGTTVDARIENIKLANSYFETSATGNLHLGSIVGYARGTIQNVKVESTVTIKSSANCNGGIAGSAWGGNATFNNCWFAGTIDITGNGQHIGGIVGRVYAGGKTLRIEHCLNSGTIKAAAGDAKLGGILGYVHDLGTLTISDTLSAKPVQSTSSTAGAVVGYIHPTMEYTLQNVYGAKTAASSILITGGGNGTIRTDSVYAVLTEDALKGDAAWLTTTLDFTTTWNAVRGGTSVLKAFPEGEVLSKWKGQGTETNPWILTNVDDLKRFAVASQGYNFQSKYVSLGEATQAGTLTYTVNEGTVDQMKANNPANWTPIGTKDLPFAGIFNGNANTIKGLYYRGTGTYVGLFGSTAEGSMVKNFKIETSYFEYNGQSTSLTAMGSVAGCGNGNFDKIKSSADVSTTTIGRAMGGLIGYKEKAGTISDCWFAGTVALGTSGRQAGGLVGHIYNGATNKIVVTMNHCLNSGTLSGTYGSALGAGGLVGHTQGIELRIYDSMSVGMINCSQTWRGSLLGRGQTTDVVVQNSYYNSEDGCEAVRKGIRIDNTCSCTVYPIGKTLSELTGSAAATNASGLSFTDKGEGIHWVTTSATPSLKYFE